MSVARRVRDGIAALLARDPGKGGRWVVVDTETSGLDPARDALLAIGAIAVDDAGILVDDSFEIVLRNDAGSDAANVVIHGIGHEAQRAGVPASEALTAFAAYVAGAPCVGFHTDFDRAVLKRACADANVDTTFAPWLDLAGMLPSVAMQGGGDPARIFREHPLGAVVPQDELRSVVAGFAGYFAHASLQPAPPGIPNLRAFQRAQASTALRWLRTLG